MTNYEEKFHNLGTPINRCVGTKEHMEEEPEFVPIAGPMNRTTANEPGEEQPECTMEQ